MPIPVSKEVVLAWSTLKPFMYLKGQPRYSNQRDQDEFDNAMKTHGSGWKNNLINFLESQAVLDFKKQNPKCVFFSKFYATNAYGKASLNGISEAFQNYIKNRNQREKKAASASGDKMRKLSMPSVHEDADLEPSGVTLPLEVVFPNTSN